MVIPPRCLRSLAALSPVLLLAVLCLVASCSRDADLPTAAPEPASSVSWSPAALQEAVHAQEQLSDRLLSLADVVATGAGLDEAGRPIVIVYLERAGATGIPTTLDGAGVRTEVSGAFRPFALTTKERPVPIGVSVGNAQDCLPGTVGCVLLIEKEKYLLSANHVLARQNAAAIGEAIVQPSLPDLDPACGPAPPSAIVGTLADFEPVLYDGKTPNRMDAAIARVSGGTDCATPELYYGAPGGSIAAPQPGLPLLKVGRTTGMTRATIRAVNAKVKVVFPSGTAVFVGQVITTNGFGAFGDSGALAVTDDDAHNPVGIVIGGSSKGSAILTPIAVVLDRFGATVCSR